MHKALHLIDDGDYMCQENMKEVNSPALRTAPMHQYKYSNKTLKMFGGRVITSTRNNTYNTSMNRTSKKKVKFATIVEDDPKAPFSIVTTPRCRGEGATPFSGLLYFTLDPYIIMLSVKHQVPFLSHWYDSTWD